MDERALTKNSMTNSGPSSHPWNNSRQRDNEEQRRSKVMSHRINVIKLPLFSLSGLTMNLTLQCGSEDFLIWNPTTSDFGPCFYHVFIQFPTYALLAIVSSYYIGKRRLSFSQHWNSCQSFIIYFRALLVSLLALTSLLELLLHYVLHVITSIEAAISSTKIISWLLHLVFVLLLKRGNSFNTRGPRMITVSWFISSIISIFSFRTRYERFSETLDDLIWLGSASVELVLQGLYFLTLIPGSSHLEQHQYRHRSRVDVAYAYEGQENNSFQGFDDEEEEFPLGTAKEGAGFMSRLFFCWVTPLMKKGACGFLRSTESLYELPHSLSTHLIANGFQPSGKGLLRSLYSSFGWEFFSIGFLKLIADVSGFCGPLFLNCLVGFIEEDKEEIWKGYAYVGGLCGASIVGALSSTHFSLRMASVNLKIRTALNTSIYRKTVHLRKTVLDQFSSGEVINFMSSDTDRITNFCPSFHAFWSLPAQVGITLYLLYLQIGVSFVGGVVFALVLIPVNRGIAGGIGTLSTKMMKYKDQRVKLMGEILYGIRTIRLHGWEGHFKGKVQEIRNKEIRCLKGRKYLDAMCVYFWATTPVLISILSFGTYILLGNSLTAAKVFTSIALFNMLISPLNALPWVLNGVVEAWVSIKRIDRFLEAEETDPQKIFEELPVIMKERTALLAQRCSFQWGGFQIKDLDLQISKGQFIGVIGNVGSGKTSILLSLLGELERIGGSVAVGDPREGIGLVLQEAWIQRGTIRSNVTFQPNTNLSRYKDVVDACCLQEDLNSFKYGDDTLVGENGAALSGGQKIRLTLARAVYQDFSTYFLDDIFAAVDYKVAKTLYQKCIMGILKNKTRIVCTHHTQFLKDADWILVVDDGRIVDEGPPPQILPRYSEDWDDSVTMFSDDTEKNEEKVRTDNLTKSSHSFQFSSPEDLNEENQAEGNIRYTVFHSYYTAVGKCLFWGVIVSVMAMQASRNFSDVWLAFWVSGQNQTSHNASIMFRSEIADDFNLPTFLAQCFQFFFPDPTIEYYFGIFLLIGLINSIITFIRAFLFAIGGISSAVTIHESILSSLLKARLSFFEANPLGRILNHFSSDVSTIDDSLPFVANILLAQAFGLIGTLILTCYALPWILAVIIPLVLVCSNIQEYYRHTARQLRRIGSISLSPLYAHFSETLKGLVEIRAMRAGRRFQETNEAHLESSQKCVYSTQAVSQWLALRLQLVGVVIISSVGLLGIFQHHFGAADPGIIGLAISYALTVTNALNGFVTVFTETEKEMVSVERACEYMDLEPEREYHEDQLRIPYLWPAQGVVQFRNVWLRYRDNLPYVLQDVSFETRPAEKIGICGRTGSGKSSLFATLFRIVDSYEGCIFIDHVDIKDVSLQELRSKMCIIPQDPLVFTGTLRENLDPREERQDEEIMRALNKCQLQALAAKLGGLDAFIGDGGNLLSAGQKQLLCLARAVLINAKILCIDEATANVDLETDQIIQATLRTSFSHSTVLTVAHRVNTILHCDRVLVMSQGEMVEFEDPTVLMQQPSSHFYQLARGNE